VDFYRAVQLVDDRKWNSCVTTSSTKTDFAKGKSNRGRHADRALENALYGWIDKLYRPGAPRAKIKGDSCNGVHDVAHQKDLSKVSTTPYSHFERLRD
jgi:hypothetical protein